MATTHPETRLDERFSSPGANAVDWPEAERSLRDAEIYWLTTVRGDGRPHVTPLIAVWLDSELHFCTGVREQKMRNLESNPRCAVTTGCNALNEEGLDLVIEGAASRVTDGGRLQRVADTYVAKYGEGWRFTVHNGAFRHAQGAAHEDENDAWVFAIAPAKILAFGRGETFSQTRWTPAQRS